MVYLDYSATTKVDERVLKRFCEVTNTNFCNPNSNYLSALEAKQIIAETSCTIAKYLNINSDEIIYTSGASESNNLAIKGVALASKKKHIITTNFEHSSVISTIGYLQSIGYHISFVTPDCNGLVQTEELEKLITDDTFLISICGVDSELGIRQPIEEIGSYIKSKHPDIIFHSDITQLVTKDNIDVSNIDLLSFSAHKLYSFKGIGVLIKKQNIKLVPLIHGGKSTTIYRSGTPQTELIDSIKTSLDILYPNINQNNKYIEEIKQYLIANLNKYNNILINSPCNSIPNILNISIIGYNSNDIQKYFADHEIYLSTKTACALNNDYSRSVYELYNDKERASSSIRISLSYKTTKKEIDIFLKYLGELLCK